EIAADEAAVVVILGNGGALRQIERILAGGRRSEGIGIEIDRDGEPRAEGAADRDRHRVDQRAIDQPAPVHRHRRKEAGNGIGGAHRIDDAALAQPYLMAGVEIGGDADERLRQVVDGVLDQRRVEDLQDAPAGDDAAIAEVEIEQPAQPHLGEAAGPGLELRQMAAEIDRADDRADRAAADDVRNDAFALEDAQHAEMTPTPRDTAAEGNADGGIHAATQTTARSGAILRRHKRPLLNSSAPPRIP